MDVLVCLAKRQGRVATRADIFREVWEQAFVSDDALTRCVRELRRALHDDAQHPSVIRTIHKRGYVLAAQVIWTSAETEGHSAGAPTIVSGLAPPDIVTAAKQPSEPHRFRARLLAAAPVSVTVTAILLLMFVISGGLTRWDFPSARRAIQDVAVLPFSNISGDPGQEYFADGITEQLITELSQSTSCRVISRTSVMRYKGTTVPIPQIAKQLAVEGLVEGSVLRSGGRVRITAQLIDGRTDRRVWSGSFEEEASDVLLLQNRVARAIAAELHVALRPRESGRSGRRPKVVPEAYESYLKGQYFFNRDQFLKAALHFREAVRIDPDFALAHAFLYEADAMESFREDRPISAIAATAMRRSLELDDSLAEARTDAGAVKLFWEWDWKAGESELRRAAELDPGSVHSVSHYAMCLHILRRWDDALREYQRILRLDPVSPRVNEFLLGFLVDTGRYESAIQQFRKTVELDPNSAGAYRLVGLAYEVMGRDAEAISAYLRGDSLSGRTEERVGALRAAAGTGGLRGYWRKRLHQMEQDAAYLRVPPLDLAIHHVRLGEKGEAMRLLEQAYEQRAPRLVWINASARWDPLRAEERFQALLRRMGFRR